MMASRIPRPAARRARARGAAGGAWRGGALLAFAATASLAVAACNLDVTTPSRLQASKLNTPSAALTLVEGAQADFQCAFGNYLVVSGLISGELSDATQTASRWSYDRRVIDPSESQYSQSSCASLGIYTPLQTARFTNASTLAKLQGWTDAEVANRQKLMAQTAAYAGYAILLLGEGFCQAPGETLGPALDQPALFAKAKDYFTTAIAAAQAASATDLLNLAYVGRARAELDAGDLVAAKADAALVPADFVYVLTTVSTSGRLENRVYAENAHGAAVNIGISYQKPDSFPVTLTSQLDSRRNPLWVQNKYTGLSAPYVVASGAEAQLILAEANGTLSGQTLVDTRRQQLFLQGTRLYDIQRFMKVNAALVPLEPPSGATYPKGGKYGDLNGKMCMPLPDIESQNNPNING
ncbi:MAG TPA: hypothetical protein VFJ74_15480 [Gemmatimonadaceae bacterium]|nr:hypothetical protein [Gemmatimonadaceae bacterium]